MRKLSIGAALVAAAIAVPLSIGSSHREAPNISLDPTADNTDVYAFTAKDAPGALTVVANWIPGEVPANGPNFFRFDDRARYYIHIDNTGDGKRGRVLPVRLRLEGQPGLVPAGVPGRRIDQRPEALPAPDATTSSVRRTTANGKTKAKRIANNLPVAPSYAGPKTFPDYAQRRGRSGPQPAGRRQGVRRPA